MPDAKQLLVDVWREACRHIEITRSAESIARRLTEQFPMDQLLVLRLDAERSCLEMVALGVAGSGQPAPGARSDCSTEEMTTLLAWCGQRQATRAGATTGLILPESLTLWALADGVARDVLAGPLPLEGQRFGALVLVARPGEIFTDRHVELAQLLLEPFSIALDNDQRVGEMAALREAAEADRRSLLTRLGRSKLGDTIVGVGSGLRAVMERVELVSRSDVPALIFGETGSGKEVVARAIHSRSPRAEGPFIRVNCGAIPHELIDSELFGHERGAFTGAVETRKGWFERADGGTLLLDELGELTPPAQVRLLRILQDGWLERVGGQKPIHVDVRIVAATHRDLAAMVAQGQFREDLWYRIAVFPIVLPSLRERREDIAELARHFAQRAAKRFGLYPAMPTVDDLKLLTAYDWPGNVRELGTVIDRAAILGDGKRLEVAKALGIATLPAATAPPPVPSEPPHAPAPVPPQGIVPLDTAMRQHIEAALTATRGRVEGPQGAARLLKINPHTLRARMRKLGVDWIAYRGPTTDDQ